MSNALSQVLQRVYVRDSEELDSAPHWLRGRVHDLLRVVFDQVLDGALHEPVRLYVAEIARRSRMSVRNTRRALSEAQELGIIKRLEVQAGRRGLGAESRRDLAAWPILVHPDLLAAASKSRTPWSGDRIAFPRPWAECSFGAAKFGPANLAAKKGKEKNHYPPSRAAPASGLPVRPLRPKAEGSSAGSRPTPSADPGACLTSGGRQAVRGGSGSRQQPSRGQVCQAQFADRRESLSVLQRWLAASRRRMEEPAAPGLEAFCQWMEASAADAVWLAKRAGAWPGAEAGDLAFALQRRSSSTGARGGTFVRGGSAKCSRVSLGELLAGARNQLADAAAVQSGTADSIEAVFWPLGDHALLLVDDVATDSIALFEGWSGVAVFETSPGNHQVMLMAPRVLRGDEVQAAQRALARRVGLTLATVQARHPRRFPGSVNRKPALGPGGSFTTRLVGEPVVGTISHELLAELLAEDAAHEPAKSTGEPAAVAGGGAVRATCAGKARTDPPDEQSRPRGRTTDRSGSGEDWARGMGLLSRVGGCDRDRLVAALLEWAANRARQGKRPDHPDNLRYACLTADNLLAAWANIKVRAGKPSSAPPDPPSR